MVLHNSKWDRKAKRQYQQKHGIVPLKPQKDESEAVAEELPSNAWRFDEELQGPIEEDDFDYSSLKAKPMDLPKGSLYERNIFNQNSRDVVSSDEDDEEISVSAITEKNRKLQQEATEADRAKAAAMREKRDKANALMDLKKKFSATERDFDDMDDDAFFNDIDNAPKDNEEKKTEGKKPVKAPLKSQQDFLDGLLG